MIFFPALRINQTMTDSVIVPITDTSLRHEIEDTTEHEEWPAEQRLREALSGIENSYAGGVPRRPVTAKPRPMM